MRNSIPAVWPHLFWLDDFCTTPPCPNDNLLCPRLRQVAGVFTNLFGGVAGSKYGLRFTLLTSLVLQVGAHCRILAFFFPRGRLIHQLVNVGVVGVKSLSSPRHTSNSFQMHDPLSVCSGLTRCLCFP